MLSTSSIASWSVETLLHELFFTCFASFYYLFIHSILFHYIHAFIWIPCALLIILDNLYARAKPKGDKGGHLPPLTPKISLHMYSTLVTPWDREKRKKKKKDPLESDTGKRSYSQRPIHVPFHQFHYSYKQLLMSSVAPIWLFFIYLFNIIIFTIFIVISFKTFYYWVMLEILLILLLMSYKLASHQSQKIISNVYSLYCLGNTNYIFTILVCKICSSYDYELAIFVYLF